MIAKQDKPIYKRLFQEIFSESPSFCDRIFNHRLDTVFDIREGDRIQSFLYAIPFFAKVEGEVFRAVYVYGVGTVKEARGKGYMKEVFKKMEAFYKDSIDFYYLVPASESLFSLYETIGYKTGFYLKKELLFPKKCELPYEISPAPDAFHSDYLRYLDRFPTAVYRSQADNDFYLGEGTYYKIRQSGFFLEKDKDTAMIREAFIEDEKDLECFLDFLYQKGFSKAILTLPEKKTPYAMVKTVSPRLQGVDFSKGYTNLNFD